MDDDITFDLQFDDEDDCILIEAVDASVADIQISKKPSHSKSHNEDGCRDDEDEGNISIGCDEFDNYTQYQEEPSGFDRHAGQLWIYPTNYPIRDYQYNIVQQALFRNTLVVLPTGLGKTFIAAVVMYNLYRWFPQGKVVFMAPTKPLVAQQIHACYNIMGIPKIDTIEMTGNLHPTMREKAWRQKRVIFLTPQVMTNDISRGSCTAKSIKCVVVDEAHKALGNHAYCQVIRELVNFTAEFRVLALSATPGSDLKAVQQVMANLLISHIELRSEDSIDIRPYTHERKVDKIVVPMGEELSEIRLKYIQIMKMVVQRLVRQRVLYNREPTKLSKFLILKARDEYRQNPPQNVETSTYGNIEADFALAMSIYHGFELLQLHGLRSLFNFLTGIKSGDKGYGRTRYELTRCSQFNDIMEVLYSKFMSQSGIGNKSDQDKKIVIGHPKMQRLEEVVVAHFKSFQEKNLDTRVMIFSQYRDSVEEIRTILDQHHPLVKVMAFIGQSSNGKLTKGYTQKEQLKVMRQFREGGFNTLVSTCVGEEGLDIGDVDLIVCFDAHKSPIRLVQRMGRTGRRRQGRIVMLVTEGKEEQIYNQSLYSKKSIHKAILNGARTLHFYTKSPRLIPADVTPKCHKMFITVKQNTQEDSKVTRKRSDSKERKKSGGQNMTISDVFSKQARSKQSDSALSKEDYEEIKQEFSQLSMKIKHLPLPKCLMLRRNEGTNSPRYQIQPEQMINLSEWMPWQNRLHHTHHVGHSSQSVHLVKDAQFIELQQSIGESGNAYGLEMDIYLNEDDIISGKRKDSNTSAIGQGSIRSFLIPSQKQGDDQEQESSSYLKHKQHKVKVPHQKGKIKLLSKDKLLEKSSLFTHIKDYDRPEKEESVDLDEAEAFDNECKKDGTNFEQSFKSHKNVTVRKKKKSKRKLLEPGSSLFGEYASNESKTAFAKRKSILEILSSNVVEQDEVNNEDFDNVHVNDLSAEREKRTSEKCGKEMKQRNSNYIRANVILDSVDTEDNDWHGAACEKDTASTSECRQIHIPTPPRIEEVADLIAAVSPSDFANINLLQIVSEMERTSSHEVLFPENTVEKNVSEMDRTSPYQVLLTENTIEKYAFSCKDSQMRISNSKSDIEHFYSSKKTKETFCVKKSVVYNTSEENESPEIVTMKSPERNFDFPGDCFVRELKEKAEDPLMRPKSPTFNITAECSLERNHESHQEISDRGMDKCLLDASTYSQRSSEVSKTVSHNVVNTQVISGHQRLPDSKKIEKSDSDAEAAGQNFGNFSLFDTMDSFLMDIDVDFHNPSEDKKLGDEKETCSSAVNKSLNSTGFATFTQAMACLHSSSSENTHEEMEEPCLDPKVKNLKSRFEEKSSLFKNVSVEMDQKSLLNENVSPPLKKTISQPVQEVNDSSRNEDVCKSSQRFSPQRLSPSVQQEPDSDDDLFLPHFELGFDFESDEIIPATPEKNKNTCKLSNSESTKTQDFTIRKRKGSDFNLIDKSGMKPALKLTNAIESANGNAVNMNCMNESDLGLFEEVQNMECMSMTPEKKKSTFKFSNSEKMKTQGFTIGKRKSSDFKHIDKSGMKPALKLTNAIESAVNMNSMNESDLGLFEEVQNMERMNMKPFASTNIKLPNRVSTDESHPVRNIDEAKSFTSPIQSDTSFKINQAALNIQSKTADNFDLSPSKKRKLPFSSYSAPSENGNGGSKLSDSISSEKWDTSFENKEKNASDSPQPQSALKKKKLSLKKSNSKENLKKESFANVPPMTRLLVGNSDTSNNCENIMAFEAERKVSTPIKGFHGAASSGTSKVGHLTPITGNVAQEDADFHDSFTIRKKKKCARLNLTTDDESDEESLTNVQQTYKSMKNDLDVQVTRDVLESTVICLGDEEDDEDDFTDHQWIEKPCREPTKLNKKQQKKLKKKTHQKLFIEDEAAESGDDASSDEAEDDIEDCYEGSFIDSRMEMTQTQGIDMRAVYLKSVKSPPHGFAKTSYRLNSKKTHSNIYSQALPEDQGLSEYEEDSFCVGSEEEDISVDSDTPSSPVRRTKKKTLKGKRRVRVLNASSSDEDEVAQLPLTQEFPASRQEARRKALLTSSEEEQSILSKHDSSLSKKQTENIPTLKEKSNLDMDTAQPNKPLCRLQDGEKCRETIQSHGLENDPGSNFDLLDMNEWFEDIDEFEEVEAQIVEKQGISGKELEPEELSPSRRESLKTSKDITVKVNTGNSICLPSLHHESKGNGCNSSQTPSTDKCVVKPMILDGAVNAKDVPKASSERISPGRAERLKKQKEKKERYQLKLAQIQHNNLALTEKSLQSNKHDVQDKKMTVTNASSFSTNSDSVLSEESSSPKPLQILVDSREISGAQEIISALRLKHKITVTARQLSACDYILSNCMAVDRLQWSEFGNCGNRTKVSTRLCDMQAHYQKCVVIIEADRVKCGQEKSARPVHHTKYLDKTLAFIIQTGIKMYFTNNTEQTAALLFELCEMEQRKGRSFVAPTNLNTRKEEMLNFVTSFPHVTMAEGLNLVHRFRSVAEMVSSPVQLIQERGSMSSEKARWIYSFLRHHFDPQMTPTSSR